MILNFVVSVLIVQAKTLMTEDEINDFFHNMIFCAYERGSEIINENCLPETTINRDLQSESRYRRRRDVFSSDEVDEQIDICHYEKCSRQSLFININVRGSFFFLFEFSFLKDIEDHTGYRVARPKHRGKSLLPIKEIQNELTGEVLTLLDVGICSGFCPTTLRLPYDHV